MTNSALPLSYSKISTHDECPRQYKYSYIDGLEEPQHPAAARGTALHSLAEMFLTGQVENPDPTLTMIHTVLHKLKSSGAYAERKLAVTVNWEPTEFGSSDAYIRGVVDAYSITGREIDYGDFKSGRVQSYHKDQLELYGLMVLVHHPEAHIARGAAWYIDQPPSVSKQIVDLERTYMKTFIAKWDRKAKKVMNDDIFPVNPGPQCSWCHFRRSNGGPCSQG